VAHSLATALVAAGVPAVIGWDGSVGDRAATLFAEELYRGLADRVDVAVAVGDARRVLLQSDDAVVRADWHLARLWLGPAGGGPVVAGNRKRSLVSATRGTKIFLDSKKQVPVAAAEMFVGRRPELQQALRALRSGERAGVLLHGQGRLGKSSLAARIADRFQDRAVAVVFKDYSALAILDAVAEAVRANQPARELIERRRSEVRDLPEAIEAVLIDLLTGPLAQSGEGQRPLLLIIDDLEQILVDDPTGPHRVRPDQAAVLAAVLRAFHLAETDSRLLLTSRFTFRLDGLENRLENVQLRPLSEVAQHKLQRRQQALTSPERLVERSGLAGRAVAVSRGNPGLQDLIVLRIVYGAQVPEARAEAAVAGMEAYLRKGSLPSDAEVREFLENLALDTLLEEAGSSNVALLRAATLFELPVPESVIGLLTDQVGGSADRLRGLGLFDPYQGLYNPGRLALAVNPLAAGRLEPLTAEEQTALAAVTVAPLFTAWGGAAAQPRWARELDLQLTRLGLLGDDPTVVAACAAGAVDVLGVGPAAVAFELGQDAIGLLDRHCRAVPPYLLRTAAHAALTSGNGDMADALLDRVIRAANNQEDVDPLDHARAVGDRARRFLLLGEFEEADQLSRQAYQLFTDNGSELEAAIVIGDIARIAFQRGDYGEAERICREVQLPVLERLGNAREIAVCWGEIADSVFQRDDYDEAERIRREAVLPVYERLGETRLVALTWGRIADIAFQRGDYEEAAVLHRKRLEVNKQRGDLDGIAAADWDLARVDLAQENYDSAFRRLLESFQILSQLKRADGVAVVGRTLGWLLLAANQTEDARKILGESLAAATKIGNQSLAGQINELLNRLDEGNEET
jgi:tetratricopeptide (TPR) repeat protein